VGNTIEGCPVVSTCPNPGMQPMLSIGYNSVWSVLCECNEHNTRRAVL